MPTLGEMAQDAPDRTPAEELAAALRRMRADANVSGIEAARRIGASQSTISRYESGRLVPSMLDAGRLGWALRAPAPERRRLVEAGPDGGRGARRARAQRVLLQQGVAQLQRRIRLQERRARAHRHRPPVGRARARCRPRATCGRSWLSEPPGRPMPNARHGSGERLGRRAQMTEPGRSGMQITTESALHWGVAGPEVMAEQCDHLTRLAVGSTEWRVGVVPRLASPGGGAVFGNNGFTIHDSETVFIGTTAGNALITDPHIVQDHLDLLARVEAIALFGAEAAAVFRRVGDLYRADLQP